ncbi:unnamed protein product [Effrenium voratum]|nr:unnamed protein product [Effrenium voratum]
MDSNPMDVHEPEWLLCPLTACMFREPVVNIFGNTYERDIYQEALKHRLVDPLTNQPLPRPDGGPLLPNRSVRSAVESFLQQHKGYLPRGWPSFDVPTSAVQLETTLSFVNNDWENLEGGGPKRLRLQRVAGCLKLAARALFSLRPVLPEYDPRTDASRHIQRVGSVLGMSLGLSMGRMGWALCARLMGALAGRRPLAPVSLLARPDATGCDWLRAVYRLTLPLPLEWLHVILGRLLLGRFVLVRLLVKEAVWAKLPQNIFYAANLCKEEVTYGMPQELCEYLFMPIALASCIHFVVLGREIAQKCAAKKHDEMQATEWRATQSLWAAVVGTMKVLPLTGAMYSFAALLVRAAVFTIGSTHYALAVRRRALA